MRPKLRAEPPASSLVYTSDAEPGITRHRWGRGFRYRLPSGRWLRDRATLERIGALAIPPAWEGVWIGRDPRGHVQATGYDARGRKQYRYHPEWTRQRSDAKFEELFDFGEALTPLRRRTRSDLRRPGLPRRKVVACVVRLLDESLIRVGNLEYARANGSRGLTTLLSRQVRVGEGSLTFRFRGKGGRPREVAVENPRLARVVRRCQELPRQPLFQYVDAEGTLHAVDSDDVNAYLRRSRGPRFTARHFRTWGASVAMAEHLMEGPAPARAARARKQREMEALRHAAALLGNTPSVARNAYVHPAISEAWADGLLADCFERARDVSQPELRQGERALLLLGDAL